MKIYLYVDENNYVSGWGSTRSSDNNIEIELDDNHEFFKTDFACWKYVNNELIFDEERQEQLIEKHKREENKPSQLDMLALAVMELTEIVIGKEDK